MNVSVITLGCKANQAESSLIESCLKNKGIRVVGLEESPDFCIINTCTVTAKSDYQSRQEIRRAIKKGATVIVTGCYSELNKEKIKSIHNEILVVNNATKLHIINMLGGFSLDKTLDYINLSKSRLFLKIQDGCNNACTYCIIPKARGKSVSIDPLRILEQVEEISLHFNEIVLTGIHLGTYGHDLNPRTTLSDLLALLLSKTAIKRIRLSSLEFNEIDDKMMEMLKDKRICRHLHIPLQSGDDHILQMMGRKYSQSEYFKKILKFYENYTEISIGTDVIVGFPGEGEIEFENTYRLIDSLPFSYLHIFPFSPRPSTIAAVYGDSVPKSLKSQRSARLRELGQIKKNRFMRAQIGRTLDCLIEEQYCDCSYIGISSNYLKVKAEKGGMDLKSIVPLRIVGLEDEMLVGIPIDCS